MGILNKKLQSVDEFEVRGALPKQLVVLIGANTATVLATAVLVPNVGNQTIGLVAIPIVLAGLWFGMRAALVSTVINVGLGLLVVSAFSTLDTAGEVLFRIGIAVALGVVAGRFGDLRARMIAETERSERLQEAYDDTSSRFQILAETATDGIVSVDATGTIIYANPAVERILGHESTGLVGQPLTMLMPEELRPVHNAGFTKYKETGNRSLDWRAVEVSGLHRDGSRVPLELSFGEYRRGDSQTFTGIIRDITDRKRAQEELERLMSSKDELVASVSHELRTPLTAVVGYAHELELRHDELDDVTKHELITSIADQADDLSFIVEDLLAAARAESGQLTVAREHVDLLSEVKRVISEGVRRVDGSDLSPAIDGVSVTAIGDQGRVRQVLRNLLTNAARYGAEPVIIEIGTQSSTGVLRVIDHGTGIFGADQQRVFEPFHRLSTDAVQPGSVGLGLSVSRMLARLMGGDIVYSRIDDRSVFTFTLPLAG